MAAQVENSSNQKVEGVMKLMSSQLAEALSAEADKMALSAVSELKHINSNTTALKQEQSRNTSKLEELLAAVKDLNASLLQGQKIVSLQWAAANTAIGAFPYGEASDKRDYMNPHKPCSLFSSGLVDTIVLSFMRDFGVYCDGHVAPKGACKTFQERYVTNKNGNYEDTWTREIFEEKLTKQIHSLTGQKPRFTTEADGQRSIWYK